MKTLDEELVEIFEEIFEELEGGEADGTGKEL